MRVAYGVVDGEEGFQQREDPGQAGGGGLGCTAGLAVISGASGSLIAHRRSSRRTAAAWRSAAPAGSVDHLAATALMTRRLARRQARPAERRDVAHGHVMQEAA